MKRHLVLGRAKMRDATFQFRARAQYSASVAHDIGQHGIAMHVSGAADQFHALHRRRRDPAQEKINGLLLAAGKLAVDQDIAHRAGKTAHGGVAKLDMKAGQQSHHLIGCGGLVAGEIGGGKIVDALLGGSLRV